MKAPNYEDLVDGKYLHCVIQPNYKIKWCKNKLSGHEWPEYIESPGYHVSGGKLMIRKYISLKSAMSTVEFDYKFNRDLSHD
jgi:hypothetical protein